MPSGFSKRLLLYAAMYAAWLGLLFIATGGLDQGGDWPAAWIRWDSEQYRKIWAQGYTLRHLKFLAHPPGYSWLVGLLSMPGPFDFHTVARIVNVEAWFVAAIVAAELMLRLGLIDAPVTLFFLLLTSPAAFFALTSYSDALFILIFWAAFFMALLYPYGKKARMAEFFLLLAAPWIRLTGYAFAMWILRRRWTAIAVFVSLAGWLALNQHFAGQMTYFIGAQQQYNMPEGGFLDGVRSTFIGIIHFPHTAEAWTDYLRYKLLAAFYFLALSAAAIWFCRRGQSLIGLTVLAALFISHDQALWRATVRYDWPFMVCLFVPLLHCAMNKNEFPKKPVIYVLLLLFGALQLALQLYFADLFRAGKYIWG